MRIILSVLGLAVGGPAGVSLFAPMGHWLAALSTALPDPATAAVMCAGLGLVVGARQARTPAD